MPYIVKILESYYLNHNMKYFKVERPPDYDFIPGQAADVSINMPEWKERLSPFTFTGLKEWDYLEFMIKIYSDHNGETNQLGKMNAGAELILHEPFGAITYRGPGVFIAGGAGITPFIAILRDLYKHKQVHGNKLIFSNKTSGDVFLVEELKKILKDNLLYIFTRQGNIGFLDHRIDRDFLTETIGNFNQYFYVCGPDDFVKDINALLLELGAKTESLVFEK